MCSDPLDPGREVRGCSAGCTLGMSDISPFRVAAALNVHRQGVSKTKKCIFKRVCIACSLISFFRFLSPICCRYEAALPNLHNY